jgi:hypothetical protein
MDDFTFNLLILFSILAYLSAMLFFWAIFKENCAVAKNIDTLHSHRTMAISHNLVDPSFKSYLVTHGKSLAFSGLIFLGIFGFFITHVCNYQ